MAEVAKIDQQERGRLCRAILSGDSTALAKLADLYRQAGYRAFAAMLQATDGTTHARAVLS